MPASRQVRRFLWGAVHAAYALPLLFATAGAVEMGLVAATVVVAFCLAAALAFHGIQRGVHRTVPAARGDLLDLLGGGWLLACAFGPLLGWLITTLVPTTDQSWRWTYGARAVLAIGLPVAMALPNARYLTRGALAFQLPLLLGLTALPIATAWWTMRDLIDGPVAAEDSGSERNGSGGVTRYLKHTGRSLGPDSLAAR